jgi:hypothetical protein
MLDIKFKQLVILGREGGEACAVSDFSHPDSAVDNLSCRN